MAVRVIVHLARGDLAALPTDEADLGRVAAAVGTPAARAWHLNACVWSTLMSGQVALAQSLGGDPDPAGPGPGPVVKQKGLSHKSSKMTGDSPFSFA